MNRTPPLSHLCRALCSSTCFLIAWIVATSSEPASADLTTMALGTSPAASSGIATTAQSATVGWVRMWASSSAGATCRPCRNFQWGVYLFRGFIGIRTLTLISSLIRSTMKICSDLVLGFWRMTASSPVCIHPSRKVSLVAFSLFR